jgi:hypothetical protein
MKTDTRLGWVGPQASYMDAQLAKVMGAMESLSLMDETIITLWGE